MGKLFIGTSGFNYKDWKEIFYPESLPQKKWLSFYSQHFKTVEINATFYGSFKPQTFNNWYIQTPKDFAFTVKGPRFITHIKRLNVTEKEISVFFDQVAPLKEKLSCVLWQFPANFVCNLEAEERIGMFVDLLPKEIRQAFEFRDESWTLSPIVSVLKEKNVGWVISDSATMPLMEKITADFAYIRFHGPGKLYASLYSNGRLQTCAEKIRSLVKFYDVYCYFNNDFYAYAIENAKKLQELINKTN